MSAKFHVGETVFAFTPELSWIVGTVAAVTENPTYKPLTDAQKQSVVADSLRKKVNSKHLYTINGNDPLFLNGSGGGPPPASGAAPPSKTISEVEEWNVDVYDESIIRNPVDDLLSLTHLHDGSILRTLAVRYFNNIVYTNIGVIVVAINPFNFKIPHYMEDKMGNYLAQKGQMINETLLPHSWAQAHNTFFELCSTGKNQSILISGESGAGKTEAAKIVLKYLSNISVTEGTAEEKAQANKIATAVTACSPILEAFGNAKTVRNDNSSRFGKLMQLKFHPKTELLLGAFTTKYLLEKSRVITCGTDERLYHSFYLAMKAPDASTTNRFTKPHAQYKSIYAGKCIENKEFSTTEEFTEVCNAMREIKIDDTTIRECWQIASAVVHACNASFVANGEGSKIKDKDSESALQDACALWGVRYDTVLKECTTTVVNVAGETATKLLPVHKATDVKDALCKAVYGNLFEWLVEKCNATCDFEDANSSDGAAQWIALLDIFGFENFDFGNTFEQLCINYANETLQQHYNWCIFTKDMEMCTAEGIDTVDIKFPDLQPTLNLIEKVLLFLDDECSLGTNEETFLFNITTKFDKKEAAFQKNPAWRDKFAIHQFAGTVIYTVTGWLEKNRDNLKDTLKTEFNADTTTNALSRDLFQCQARVEALAKKKLEAAGGGGGNKKNKQLTAGGYFKGQMKELMDVINSTNPHWIRCVKPHTLKKPLMLDGSYTLKQLEFAGILGTVKIRKAGYPIRFPLTTFCKQYVAVKTHLKLGELVAVIEVANAAQGNNSAKAKDNPLFIAQQAVASKSTFTAATALKELVAHTNAILAAMGYKDKKYAQVGKTIVFIKNDAYHLFEAYRRDAMKSVVNILQRTGHGYQARLNLFKTKMARIIQPIGQGYLCRLRLFKAYCEVNRAKIIEMRRIAAEQKRAQEEADRKYREAFAQHERQMNDERREIEVFLEEPGRNAIVEEELEAFVEVEFFYAKLAEGLWMERLNAKLLSVVQPMAEEFVDGCEHLSEREDREFTEMLRFHFYTMVDLSIGKLKREVEAAEEAQRAAIETELFHSSLVLKAAKEEMYRTVERLHLRVFYEKQLAKHRKEREDAAIERRERDLALLNYHQRSSAAAGASASHSASPSSSFNPRSAVAQEVYDLATRYNALLAAEERVNNDLQLQREREETRNQLMGGGSSSSSRTPQRRGQNYERTLDGYLGGGGSVTPVPSNVDGGGVMRNHTPHIQRGLSTSTAGLRGGAVAGALIQRSGTPRGGRVSSGGGQHHTSIREFMGLRDNNSNSNHPAGASSIYRSNSPIGTSIYAAAGSPRSGSSMGRGQSPSNYDGGGGRGGDGGEYFASSPPSRATASYPFHSPQSTPTVLSVGMRVFVTVKGREGIVVATQVASSRRQSVGVFLFPSSSSSSSSSTNNSQQLLAAAIEDPRSVIWCESDDCEVDEGNNARSSKGYGGPLSPPSAPASYHAYFNGSNLLLTPEERRQHRRRDYLVRRHFLGESNAAAFDASYFGEGGGSSGLSANNRLQQSASPMSGMTVGSGPTPRRSSPSPTPSHHHHNRPSPSSAASVNSNPYGPASASSYSNHRGGTPVRRGPYSAGAGGGGTSSFSAHGASDAMYCSATDGSSARMMTTAAPSTSRTVFPPTFTARMFFTNNNNGSGGAAAITGMAHVTKTVGGGAGWAGEVATFIEMEQNADRFVMRWV